MTRSLNYISSRLAFHEMRVNANLKIMSSLIQDCLDLVLEAKDDDFRKTKLLSISKWLQENLERLRAECQGLLLEVACNQKIAQSQLEIVRTSIIVSCVFLNAYRSTIWWRNATTKIT